MKAHIGILGAGTWGVALARLLYRNAHQVTVWSALEQEIMFVQQPIAAQMSRRRVGRTYDVLIEDYSLEDSLYFGRSYGEAPGVDGMIAVESDTPLRIGMYYKVRILRADDYELLGRAIQDE